MSKDRWIIGQIKNNDIEIQMIHNKYEKSINFEELNDKEINKIERQKGYDFLYKKIFECKLPKEEKIEEPASDNTSMMRLKSNKEFEELYVAQFEINKEK